LAQSSESLIGNANLIKKVYFPRLIVPVAAVLCGIVDFGISFVVLLTMMLYYRISPTANIVWLPLFLLFAFIASLGVGLWLSALNLKYRDVRYVVPFLTQIWLFLTPIAYPSSLLPARWQMIYGLNPMAGVVSGFRWALLGTPTEAARLAATSAIAAILLLASGAFYFRRLEKTFADIV
jgi:lipopolysaccharide transport system permease protein